MKVSPEETFASIFQPETSVEEIDNFLKSIGSDDSNEQYIYTLPELLQRQNTPNRYLLGSILPVTGLAAIVGAPDCGKSMFCRELAFSIALGKPEFVGMPLSLRHQRAIYVSTEDGVDSTGFAFSKQLRNHGGESGSLDTFENLQIIFADQIDTDTLLRDLLSMLSENPVDLIVLDSYGDLFSGKDGNANMEVRRFLKPFNAIANRFECLMTFVHHINKSGYNESPNQRHVQGAGSLGQKLRLMLELRKGDSENGLRYLSVLKGNGVSSNLKKAAVELRFDEQTFTFSQTGNEKPLSEFAPVRTSKPKKDYSVLFGPSEKRLSYSVLVSRYMEHFHQSEPTAKRNLPLNLRKDEEGLYLNPRYQGITVSDIEENDTMIPEGEKE